MNPQTQVPPQQVAYPGPTNNMAAPQQMQPMAVVPEKETIADLTVSKKGVGLKVSFAIVLLLLLASVAFGITTYNNATQKDAEIAELKAEIEEKNSKIQVALDGLGLEKEEDLTHETLDRIHSENATRITISFDGMSVNHATNWMRMTKDHRYMLANVTIGGVGYYYYRKDGGAWKMAYAYSNETVLCRSITLEAMQVISEIGIDKRTYSNGAKYDCTDVYNGNNMLYNFDDAIKAKVYKTDNTNTDGANSTDIEAGVTTNEEKSTSASGDASKMLDKN